MQSVFYLQWFAEFLSVAKISVGRMALLDAERVMLIMITMMTLPRQISQLLTTFLNMKKGDDNLTDVGYWILSDNTYDIQYEYRYTTVDFKPQGYVIALEFSFENNEKAYIVVNLSQYTSYESKYYDTSLYNYYSPKDYVEKTTADTLFSSLKYINANDIESINSEYEGSRYMVSSVLPPENLFVMLPDYRYEGIVEKYYKNDRDFGGKYTEYRYCDKELSDQLTSDTSISSSYPYGLITIYDNRSISEAERIDWHLDMIEKIQENLSLCYREK